MDGSAFPKKGTPSCGVPRQWCGRLGKVDNCQVGVFLACVSGGRAAPLDHTLSLPREWAADPVRRRRCHVPPTVRFAEKWQLALKQIPRSRGVPHGGIVADDEFGRVAAFRAKLRARKERDVLDVPCNTLLRFPAAPPVASPPQTATQTGATQTRTPPKRGRPRLPASARVGACGPVDGAAARRGLAADRGPSRREGTAVRRCPPRPRSDRHAENRRTPAGDSHRRSSPPDA